MVNAYGELTIGMAIQLIEIHFRKQRLNRYSCATKHVLVNSIAVNTFVFLRDVSKHSRNRGRTLALYGYYFCFGLGLSLKSAAVPPLGLWREPEEPKAGAVPGERPQGAKTLLFSASHQFVPRASTRSFDFTASGTT